MSTTSVYSSRRGLHGIRIRRHSVTSPYRLTPSQSDTFTALHSSHLTVLQYQSIVSNIDLRGRYQRTFKRATNTGNRPARCHAGKRSGDHASSDATEKDTAAAAARHQSTSLQAETAELQQHQPMQSSGVGRRSVLQLSRAATDAPSNRLCLLAAAAAATPRTPIALTYQRRQRCKLRK